MCLRRLYTDAGGGWGHTIGHALESLGNYRGLIHGEAVGIGLVQEADLAVYVGLCGQEVADRIRRLVQRASLSDCMPKVSFAALWGAMQHDKKVIGGKVVGVWPVRIGEVVIRPLEQSACESWYRSRQGGHTAMPRRKRRAVRRFHRATRKQK